jgi:hypothetical protein
MSPSGRGGNYNSTINYSAGGQLNRDSSARQTGTTSSRVFKNVDNHSNHFPPKAPSSFDTNSHKNNMPTNKVNTEDFEDPRITRQAHVTFGEEENQRMLRFFQYYCSLGDQMNKTKLKGAKFIKLLRDSGIVKSPGNDENSNPHHLNLPITHPIKSVEADLIFTKMTNGTNQIQRKNSFSGSSSAGNSARGAPKSMTQGRMEYSNFL